MYSLLYKYREGARWKEPSITCHSLWRFHSRYPSSPMQCRKGAVRFVDDVRRIILALQLVLHLRPTGRRSKVCWAAAKCSGHQEKGKSNLKKGRDYKNMYLSFIFYGRAKARRLLLLLLLLLLLFFFSNSPFAWQVLKHPSPQYHSIVPPDRPGKCDLDPGHVGPAPGTNAVRGSFKWGDLMWFWYWWCLNVFDGSSWSLILHHTTIVLQGSSPSLRLGRFYEEYWGHFRLLKESWV